MGYIIVISTVAAIFWGCRDNGGHYLWQQDTGRGAIPLAFESVLSRAESADVWLYTDLLENRNLEWYRHLD